MDAVAAQQWIHDEQGHLWHELKQTLDEAINHSWSIAAGNVVIRIIQSARLVGPNDRGGVPWALVAGGVYEAVLQAGRIRYSPVLPPVFKRWDEMMAKQNGIRATQYAERYAATVASIGAEAEWLRGE